MIAVFLDRDGVINEDRDDYVKGVDELKVYPWAAGAVRRLNEAGLPVFVVSNQQAIAKGIIGEADLEAIQEEITRRMEAAGARISGFYYCRHLATDHCSCRKPAPGMLIEAAKDNDIDLSRSFMVGDAERDIIAGRRAGCWTVLVLSGKLTQQDAAGLPCQPDHVADDLSRAVDYILSRRP